MSSSVQKALKVFKTAAVEVPAYKKFLKKNKVRAADIKTASDFDKIPIMDKANYLYQYPLFQLLKKNHVPAMVYASSGSSGQPTFWFRNDEQEKFGGEIHQKIFETSFGIKKQQTTLVVICFSMGMWVAGNYTLAACRYLSSQGFSLTTATPGTEKADIFNVLKKLAPHYRNVVLAGYPPFVMDIINQAHGEKFLPKRNFFVLTAGDKFSEKWRDAVLKLINHKDPNRVVNIYGCADAAILGYETPLSVFLRRSALNNEDLRRELFDKELATPALVQYDPTHIFFEEHNGELIFTANTAIPLIRYNLHDIGNVYSPEQIKDLIAKHGKSRPSKKLDNSLGLIVKKGRGDVSVTFYALNIYPENIRAVTSSMDGMLSGAFLAYNKNSRSQKKQKLYLDFELAEGVKSNKKLQLKVQQQAVKILVQHNMEYRKLVAVLGSAAYPEIVLSSFGSEKKFSKSSGLVQLKGKKTKMNIKHA